MWYTYSAERGRTNLTVPSNGKTFSLRAVIMQSPKIGETFHRSRNEKL